MAMSYTIGNWTVTSMYTDTSATTKTFDSVPTLSASDYSLVSENPGENIYSSVTSLDSESHEKIRYGISKVNNVYKKMDIAPEQQDITKEGRQILVEVSGDAKAVNAINGNEERIPYAARLVVIVPNGPMVTSTFVNHAIGRCLGAADGTRVLSATATGFHKVAVTQPKGDLRLD